MKCALILCFEDEFDGVETFASHTERGAYASGVVRGASRYGAGAIGVYDWPEESQRLIKECGRRAYDQACRAIHDSEGNP